LIIDSPNATKGGGALRLSGLQSTNNGLQLLTAQGKLIASCKVTASMQIAPVGRLEKGVYFVKLTSGDKTDLHKMLVQ
jgi:hypothetical protein